MRRQRLIPFNLKLPCWRFTVQIPPEWARGLLIFLRGSTATNIVIRLKSEWETRPGRNRWLRRVCLSALLVLTILLAERWRGYFALSRWKHRMAAKGEIFQPNRIWPQPSSRGLAFSNELQQAVAQLPPGLDRYSGRISGMLVQEPGLARRGSQESNPYLAYRSDGTNRLEHGTWAELELEIRHAQPALQSLRSILRDPPADRGYDILDASEKLKIPKFVNIRRAAQALQAAVIFDLHRSDLAGAKDNLVALAAFTRVYADEPTIVNYMVRLAILGLSIETAWDALQADGWTDAQLAELQRAFQCDALLAQMPRTIEAERATQLFELDWFSSHSYMDWVARYESIYESLRYEVPVSAQVYAIRHWREWVFHPLWKFAWADQEKLLYLQNVQRELEILREAVQAGSGVELCRRMESLRTNYCPPMASWRFYLALPLAGQMSERIGGSILSHDYPYADFCRAWSTSMKTLTLCQMVRAAIGIKRYQLRHAKPPASLDALVLEFMDQVPRDFTDGQALRYNVRSDGSYCLYSIGNDAHDDQGNPVPPADGPEPPSAWNGRDWVWPRPAPAAPESGSGLASQ